MSEIQDDTRPERTRTARFLFSLGDHNDKDAEKEEILFDPDKLLLSEVLAIEKAAQLTWPQVMAGLNIGAASAFQACIWVMRKRSNPKLKLSDVEFSWGDLRNLDPDYRPEYGGIPRGAAFGDDLADAVDGAIFGDDADDSADGDGPKEEPTTPPLPPEPAGPPSTNSDGSS